MDAFGFVVDVIWQDVAQAIKSLTSRAYTACGTAFVVPQDLPVKDSSKADPFRVEATYQGSFLW